MDTVRLLLVGGLGLGTLWGIALGYWLGVAGGLEWLVSLRTRTLLIVAGATFLPLFVLILGVQRWAARRGPSNAAGTEFDWVDEAELQQRETPPESTGPTGSVHKEETE